LPDAADRIRVEPRSPATKRVKTQPARMWKRALRALAPKTRRGAAGAALLAMMIGIVVNAVALQHGRRPDLPPDPGPTASVKLQPVVGPAPTATVAAASSAALNAAAPSPPARPASNTVALARAPKAADPISELLHSSSGDNRRLVSAAQGALAKLGFDVKATGAMDANTRSAIVEFDKSRHLPVSTEITPKLVKTLTAATSAN
jgi:Putative peptidoglycan binding domain